MGTKEPDKSDYGGQTVVGPAWPHVDEEAIGAAADAFGALAANLRDHVVPDAGKQRMRLSDFWEGSGAQAALDEASGIISDHELSQAAADRVKGKLKLIEKKVADTKDLVNSVAQQVQKKCEGIHNEEPPQDGSEDTRAKRIEDEIKKGKEENIGHVADAAKSLAHHLHVPSHTPGADGKVPAPQQQSPAEPPGGQDTGVPTTPISNTTTPAGPSGQTSPSSSKGQDTGVPTTPISNTTTPAGPSGQTNPPSSGGQDPGTPTTGASNPTSPGPSPTPANPKPQPSTPAPAIPAAAAPGTPSTSPSTSATSQGPQVSPMSVTGSKPDAAAAGSPAGAPKTTPTGMGAQPTNPLDQFQKGMAEGAKSGGAPQSTPSTPSQPVSSPSTSQPLNAPPAAGASPTSGGSTPGTMAQAASGSVGAGSAPVSAGPTSGAAPSSPMPLGPPPTAPPAAPAPPTTPVGGALGPGVNPAATTASGGAQVAPIPISAARAERDAAIAAATAGALRHKTGGHDPLSVARRIAAALNASDMVNAADYKFFWITAVTVDGKIVVANNYGVAYIPAQVHLPEQVIMASADESIPPAERASWVNQPSVAVQRWAQHHASELRVVIATEDQFKNSDAGVHQEVLTAEDIPPSGKMAGRDRLQVIAPQASAQLSRISDAELVNVLPPAPADVNPPEDRRTALWDKVWQPLASRSPKRGGRHLQAFVEYATHAQEQAIYTAHTAADSEAQRQAVKDFIYWQHVGQLIADALAS